MSRLSHESVLDALGGKDSLWAWVWSSMVNLIPYILIGGVFTGNKLVTSLEQESSGNLPKDHGKPSGNLPESSSGGGKVSENFPKDWRKLRPGLTESDVANLANLSADQVKAVAKKYGVEERTVSNWRNYARKELGLVIVD
jgi:hypothetical protein